MLADPKPPPSVKLTRLSLVAMANAEREKQMGGGEKIRRLDGDVYRRFLRECADPVANVVDQTDGA